MTNHYVSSSHRGGKKAVKDNTKNISTTSSLPSYSIMSNILIFNLKTIVKYQGQ